MFKYFEFIETALYGSQKETSVTDGRLPLVDATIHVNMSTRLLIASKYSMHWPVYGLKKNLRDFTILP